MDFLYRTYSDDSHGTNNRLGFKPAFATAGAASGANLKNELDVAIRGKSAPHNPFIFCTPSLLLALIFAHHRQANNEKNIHIACIDVNASRTSAGKAITFDSVACLATKLGLQLKAVRDGTPRGVAEYVTMDRIKMLGDSRTASFDTILRDLYTLYPAIKQAFGMRRRASGMNMELRFLREMYFETDFCSALGPARITVAAKIASAFMATLDGYEKVAPHILAAVLSLQGRDLDDERTLSKWFQANDAPRIMASIQRNHYAIPYRHIRAPAASAVVIDLTQDDDTPGGPAVIDLTAEEPGTEQLPLMRSVTRKRPITPLHIVGAPEMDTFHAMWTILKGRRIPDDVLTMPSDTSQRMISAEIEQWEIFVEQKNAEHRSRQDRRSRRGRQDLAPRPPRQPRDHDARPPRIFAVRKPRTELYKSRRDRRY